jgi:hypothetical protein
MKNTQKGPSFHTHMLAESETMYHELGNYYDFEYLY